MHAPNKSKILNIVFLPIFILKNQLINAAIVLFSSNPNNQIISTGAIFIAFTIYSLIFCPYRILFRVFYHISDLLLIGQLVFLFLVISTEYGATYSLNILNIEPSIYKYAWILLIFDFMQMINYGVLSFVILYQLAINQFRKNNKPKLSKNKVKKLKDNQNKYNKTNKNSILQELNQSHQAIITFQNIN